MTSFYVSPTNRNWADDDEDDWDSDTYMATADKSAPTIDDLGPVQLAPPVLDEYVVLPTPEPTPSKSKIDYSMVDPDSWPTVAWAVAAEWSSNNRRPAYIELSNDYENGCASPDVRKNYHSAWLNTKLTMGVNMKLLAMMRSSPLQRSMTWTEDSEGEYIEEAGIVVPEMLSPTLLYDSHSDEEQDEVVTPPASPTMVRVVGKEVQVEEYDPVMAAIDMATGEEDVLYDFSDFGYISEFLDINDILGDSVRVEAFKAPQSVADIHAGAVEATHLDASAADSPIEDEATEYKQPQNDNQERLPSSEDSTPPVKTTASLATTPDVKCLFNIPKTSLVWDTLATGWFALSSVPWGRIAVAAAGTLVDTAIFMARH
ncbi:hypothetical protein N0V94_007501 [Neodidymelliopsis sp. IMI 364377]|nr:hypothetical protein N0V94_007501 [Neodidymelliopsis sp. IMI 364377]